MQTMLKAIVVMLLLFICCSSLHAQVTVTVAPTVVPLHTYTVVPPAYTYIYQPPQVQVRVTPRPSFYVKISPFRWQPFRNVFRPWVPVYVLPPIVQPVTQLPSPTPNT